MWERIIGSEDDASSIVVGPFGESARQWRSFSEGITGRRTKQGTPESRYVEADDRLGGLGLEPVIGVGQAILGVSIWMRVVLSRPE